jgi:aminopeptidase YwaD
MKKNFTLIALLLSLQSIAQINSLKTINSLKEHIYTLADDSMGGRNTGTTGEDMAIKYISIFYQHLGLTPMGTQGFTQPFEFNYGVKYNGNNSLSVNGVKIELDKSYFPLTSSGSGKVSGKSIYAGYGIDASDITYNDYKKIKSGGIFVIDLGSPDAENAHSKYYPYTDINTKIQTAINHDASALIFINSDTANVDDIKKDFTKNSPKKSIPIIFINSRNTSKLDFKKTNQIQLEVNLETIRRTGKNIIAYLNNNAPTTIVIGAHFDHLGLGHDGNSLYAGPEEIHNGADDNASGTAAVMELARWATNSTSKNNNYLFINFSGEELGLLGSKYFVEHATIDTSKINYMINMDMIGRYRSEKGMEISGIGTSPYAFDFIRRLTYDSLKIKIGEQGPGPTDHTSFYYANIPVINLFTGTHEDYHKPSDDAEKINYEKESSIIQLITMMIDTLNNKGTLPFSKTKEQDNGDVPSFKVRLGIIPDYMYENPGLRVDGVSDNQPAQKGGLVKGDVITQIDSYPIPDIMAYMKALSMFQKGDKVKIKYKRDNIELETEIQF